MSYSLDVYPNDPSAFEVPQYAVWIETANWTYDNKSGDYKANRSKPALGQIRHFSDLGKAKRRVGSIATCYSRHPTFDVDWAIYQWNGSSYELLYDGLAGETKANNELFQKRLTKKALGGVKPKKRIEYEVDAAVASILESVS